MDGEFFVLGDDKVNSNTYQDACNVNNATIAIYLLNTEAQE
jgi:hypothetical protein